MSEDSNQENSWLDNFTSQNIIEHFSEIRTYAYIVFDQLDEDKNGFLDTDELVAALESSKLSTREKSFIQFLLDNQGNIAGAFEDHDSPVADGISRHDLEEYFKLISSLVRPG